MDAAYEVQLLKKIEPFKDEIIERPEALRLPQPQKAPILSELVPADDRTEELIHQHILQNHGAANNLILR